MVEHPPLTPFGSALAGALGAVFSNAVVYPLDTVKTRLQALPTDQLGEKNILPANTDGRPSATRGRGLIGRLRRWEMLQMLIRIIKSEGISGAFKGFTANMLNTFSMQFAYFFFHTLLRSNLIKHIASRQPTRSAASLSTSSELLVGAAAGALAQIFTIPVSVIATRQQLWIPPAKGSVGSSASVREPSLVETAHEIISEGGVTALWTGLKPGLVLTVNPAITYGAFERLKSAVLDKPGRVEKKLGALEAFAIGVGSKAIATVVTYPYIFAKVRLQAKRKKVESAAAAAESQEATSTGEKHGHEETYAEVAAHEPSDPSAVVSSTPPVRSTSKGPPVTAREIQHTGAIPLLAAVYKKQGLAGWYKGLTAQLIKAVLCQGILFVSKDQFEVWAWLILSSFAKIRQRVAVKV